MMKIVLLIFVLFEVFCCEGCWEQEREALLGLNSRLGLGFGYPLSWIDGTDCCHWEGVECNTTTGRVASLVGKRYNFYINQYVESNYSLGPWYLNYSDFIAFNDLKSLDLSFNNIAGCAESEGLENLQVLHLSANALNNVASIQSCFDGLSSIKSLYLRSNEFNATSFHVFETLSSKLLNLEVLDISVNENLTNDILPSLGGFTSLKNLYLSQIGLSSDLHIQGLCSKLVNLEVLDMSYNNFNDSDIGTALSGFSSLNSLNLKLSQMTPRSILNISKLRSLEILHLDGNFYLNESILWSLENEGFAWPIGLQVLGLSANNFSNNFLSSSLRGLGSLKSLDLSANNLEGSLNISGLSALTNLETLDLSDNQISHFVVHQGSKSLSRLDVLNLNNNVINGSKLRKSLWAFSSIRELYLTGNEFEGTVVAGDFGDLSNLEHLVLIASSKLENEFFKSIGELTSLKSLSLWGCGINGTLPAADWSKLKKLEELDLTLNEFVGPLPLSFVNMTSLLKLDLSHNHFTGNFSSNLASLTSLEYFRFEENQFEVPISFTPFANHSNLKFIYGEGNRVIHDSQPSLQTWIPKFQLQVLSLSSTTITDSLPLPKFLLYQYNLTTLDFTSCKLEGEFPNWLLENNTKMTELVLRNCSFSGSFQPPLHPLQSMRRIDVSDNVITGEVPSKNMSSIFPNMIFLNMSINKIQGSISNEFGQMKYLDTLDLSENHLSGKIPKNISGESSLLRLLRLSDNKLDGPVFPTLSTLKHLEQLYLDGNRFSGSISCGFSNTSLLSLVILSMSHNHLEGSIPAGLLELESLVYLDISQNDFTGLVPSFVSSSLRSIHLSNNRLSGLSKRMFTESSSIWILDLSYNEITSNIHSLVQDLSLTRLNTLLLKGNHFSGQIPKQICQLMDLIILDLSHNNFSGSIPSCLGTVPFKNVRYWGEQLLYSIYYIREESLPYVQEKANFTTKKNTYTYTGELFHYMTGIDLSFNKLTGSIPSELGNLTRIRALNLSHNYLTGKIPATFSGLVQVESLDLSFNKLSSKIPSQLNELTSLEVFSVAHNNLSGETPERKAQFITFDESSYVGNPFLCGPPLLKSCHPERTPPANGSYTDGDSGGLVDMYAFWVSFGVSYTMVLLVIAAVLYINPFWRRAWFYYLELVSLNCYYFIEDNLRKLSYRGN